MRLKARSAARFAGWLMVASAAGCGGDDGATTTSAVDTGVLPGDTAADSSTDGGGDSSIDSGSSDTPTDTGPSIGDGKIGKAAIALAGGVTNMPFDATPDSTGATVYFTAIGEKGPGVFKVAATGGTATEVASGASLVAPTGIAISADDKTIFVADPAATTAADRGAIFVVPTTGGPPVLLAGTDGFQPSGLEVVGDMVFFTGVDKTSIEPGVFKVPAAGGAVTVVAKGGVFRDPSGVTVSASGDIYVVDTLADGSRVRGAVIKVTGSTAVEFVGDLPVGFPAGIALSLDESALLVSGLDPVKRTDTIWRITLGAKERTPFSAGIDKHVEPAGLHRAKKADVYGFVDSTAKGGTVFVLSK